MKKSSSAKFPYRSKFVKVLSSKIHYVESGKGDPIVFLHGMPTSSYLWRNIIPGLKMQARCIAPDLIGMGKSSKPNIPYRIFDHIKYMEKFIDTLKLKNITLVMHGFGSIIGLDYAMRHPDKVKAIAFYESYVGPLTWNRLSLPIQHLHKLFHNRKLSQRLIMEDNDLINKIFNSLSLRKLTAKELSYYRAPFIKPKDRRPLWQYISDSPMGHPPKDVTRLISRYMEKLQQSTIPKLMLYAIPGFMTPISTIEWCKTHLKNLTIVDLGEGLHFVQEYNPKLFREAVARWYSGIKI